MKTIHWIIIGIAILGVAVLVIYLVTKKPRKPKPGEIIKDPITGKTVEILEVDPITKEPTVVKEPGKEPIYPGRKYEVGEWIPSPMTGVLYQVLRVHPESGILLMVKQKGFAPKRVYYGKGQPVF